MIHVQSSGIEKDAVQSGTVLPEISGSAKCTIVHKKYGSITISSSRLELTWKLWFLVERVQFRYVLGSEVPVIMCNMECDAMSPTNVAIATMNICDPTSVDQNQGDFWS